MTFEFELPDVGEGVAEGEIVAWHVEPGDRVEEDQVLAEVETDKAVVDLPSPVDGVVKELHAEVGDVVPVGSVVITIDVDGEPETEDDEDATATAPEDATATAPEGRVFAPPNVRRLARELGVDVTAIDGTGPSGRLTEADVRSAAESEDTTTESDEHVATEPDSAVEESSDVETADRDRTLATPATRSVARDLDVDIDEVPTEKTRDGEPFVEAADVQAYADAQRAPQQVDAETPSTVTASTQSDAATERVTTEPYRGVRRTIGERMADSAFTAPHATHHDTAEVSALVETREELKIRAEEKDVSLTYLPFVMKAIVAGLKEYPALNSELDEDAEEIRYKHYYNIGVAVATDAGLMVPVVEDVDQKGLLELAAETNDLATRARNRELSPDELQDSTFTITNFGAIGGEYATPILNYPETGILGLGAIEHRPVVEEATDSASGQDAHEVVARPTLPLSLSIDHRVIDGAEAAQFCNTVIEYLENPTLLLLE